jgi:hypothetical protein
MRQVAAFEGGQGIFHEQRPGLFLAELFFDDLKRRLQFERPATHVMGVARHDVDQSFPNPAKRIFLRAWTKGPGERTCGDLHKTAQPDPLGEPLGRASKNRVSLRVRDDRMESH